MNRQFNIGVPFGTFSLNGHTTRFHKCVYNKNTLSSVESRLLGAHGALEISFVVKGAGVVMLLFASGILNLESCSAKASSTKNLIELSH